jgi:hypothetical protein
MDAFLKVLQTRPSLPDGHLDLPLAATEHAVTGPGSSCAGNGAPLQSRIDSAESQAESDTNTASSSGLSVELRVRVAH